MRNDVFFKLISLNDALVFVILRSVSMHLKKFGNCGGIELSLSKKTTERTENAATITLFIIDSVTWKHGMPIISANAFARFLFPFICLQKNVSGFEMHAA